VFGGAWEGRPAARARRLPTWSAQQRNELADHDDEVRVHRIHPFRSPLAAVAAPRVPCSSKDFDSTSFTRGFRIRQAFRVASAGGNATLRSGLGRFPSSGNAEETGDDVVVVKERE
jgi:hypothetical protein